MLDGHHRYLGFASNSGQVSILFLAHVTIFSFFFLTVVTHLSYKALESQGMVLLQG